MNPVVINFEETRKKKGVTKSHIAKHCGHSVTWYADIVKGRRRVYLDDFLMIADALGEQPKFFLNQTKRNA